MRRRFYLTVLAIIGTLLLGVVFESPGYIYSSSLSYALPVGWSAATQCAAHATNCISANACISPVKVPTRGIPFRSQRVAPAGCQVQTNVVGSIANWALYVVVSFMLVFGFIGPLMRRRRKSLYE